jgi:aryl-alcohol dehydrogenase-like predicted oxidoreductase
MLPIPGTASRGQLEENIAAAHLPFGADDLVSLASA